MSDNFKEIAQTFFEVLVSVELETAGGIQLAVMSGDVVEDPCYVARPAG